MPLYELCATPGCTELVAMGRRYCATHTRADSRRRRQKPSGQVCASKEWHGKGGTRERVLTRDDYTCQVCGAEATHVDHQPPITVLLSQGLSPFDDSTCRAVCASCAGRADGHRAARTTECRIVW
jgi:5-methylcytosine-specific restriction endonuclease McrA